MAHPDMSVLEAVDTVCSVKVPHTDADWEELGGFSSFSFSGNEVSGTEITRMGGNNLQTTGHASAASVSGNLSIYHPQGDLTSRLVDALNATRPRTYIGFRLHVPEGPVIFNGASPLTAAIARADGAVTFAGVDSGDTDELARMLNSEEVGVGTAIKIGSAIYVISDKGDATGTTLPTVNVKPFPASDVAGAAFMLVDPLSVYQVNRCRLMTFGNAEIGADGTLTTTIGVLLKGQHPKWEARASL